MDDARERDVRARRRARRVTKRSNGARVCGRIDTRASGRVVGWGRRANTQRARRALERASSPSDARGEARETMEEKKKR